MYFSFLLLNGNLEITNKTHVIQNNDKIIKLRVYNSTGNSVFKKSVFWQVHNHLYALRKNV